MTFAASTPAGRQVPVIRVFVSSTFSDLVAERNALAADVWPVLEVYCRQRGFTFQAIDLRWGVPSEAGLDQRTIQFCLEELHCAQETSPEPNFLILLGNKYGWRPLPETISTIEFAILLTEANAIDVMVLEIAAKLQRERSLESLTCEEQRLWKLDQRLSGESFSSILKDWYRHDSNSQPSHHVLRARTDSPDGQDYTNLPDSDGKRHDTQAWLNVQDALWQIVNRGYSGEELVDRFKGGTNQIPSIARFQSSATEQEIWHGALQVEHAHNHIVAWFREINRTGGDPEPSRLKRFIDLRPHESPDADAAAALDQLKIQVEQKLKPVPIVRATCAWEKIQWANSPAR